MIKITYHPGYAVVRVGYSYHQDLCKLHGVPTDWSLLHRNGASVTSQQFSSARYMLVTRVAVFDTDTVYDPKLDDEYYCHTPEAECALEIARGALNHD